MSHFTNMADLMPINNTNNVVKINLNKIDCPKFDHMKIFEYYLNNYKLREEFNKVFHKILHNDVKTLFKYFKKLYKKDPTIHTPYEKIRRIWDDVYKPYTYKQITNVESNMDNTYNTVYPAKIINQQ